MTITIAKLAKALRMEAKRSKAQRTSALRSEVNFALSRISKEDRWALKSWYMAGVHAWTLEHVAKRLEYRLAKRRVEGGVRP
jgi:hypothetical protein